MEKIDSNRICQVGWAVEYTDCISAEEYDFPNECPGI